MSCSRCMTNFGVLKKEHGCANCRYSFCAKCVSQKIVVPRIQPDGKKHAVCQECYLALTNEMQAQAKAAATKQQPAFYQPTVSHGPAAAAQHHQFMSLPDLPPPSMRGSTSAATNQRASFKNPTNQIAAGGNAEDRALAERLERLKQERRAIQNPIPSQSEIEERLANLRDCDPELIRNPGSWYRSEQPSETKPTNPTASAAELMSQMRAEVQLEDGPQSHNSSAAPDADSSAATFEGADSSLSSVEKSAREVDDLMRQAQEEAKSAMASLERDKDVQEQLSRLRQDTLDESKKDAAISKELGRDWDEEPGESDEVSDQDAMKIAKMILEEEELNERLAAARGRVEDTNPKPLTEDNEVSSNRDASDVEPDSDVDTWCCICNADATIQCPGCDQDLYCDYCFREGHDREDFQQHKPKRYRRPQQKGKETTV